MMRITVWRSLGIAVMAGSLAVAVRAGARVGGRREVVPDRVKDTGLSAHRFVDGRAQGLGLAAPGLQTFA